MNDNEKKLVIDLALNNIDKQRFLDNYPIDIDKNKSHITNLLKSAIVKRDSDIVECGLILGECFGFDDNVVSVLCELLSEDWHFKHEDIARLLKKFKSPESIDVLYQTAQTHYEYLNYDESYALAVKCIWALDAIDTAESINKLKDLAKIGNKVIEDAAKEQLKKHS